MYNNIIIIILIHYYLLDYLILRPSCGVWYMAVRKIKQTRASGSFRCLDRASAWKYVTRLFQKSKNLTTTRTTTRRSRGGPPGTHRFAASEGLTYGSERRKPHPRRVTYTLVHIYGLHTSVIHVWEMHITDPLKGMQLTTSTNITWYTLRRCPLYQKKISRRGVPKKSDYHGGCTLHATQCYYYP